MKLSIRSIAATAAVASLLAAAASAQTLVEDQRLFEPALAVADAYGAAVATSGSRIAVGAPKADIVGSQSGVVYVYVADGAGGWLLEDQVEPFGLFTNDEFGTALDMEGERLLVGAPLADVAIANEGAAYIIERQPNGTWLQVALLAASDGSVGDAFGRSVALFGDRALVGAPDDDPNGVNSAGSAYLFERQANGTWLEVAKFTSANAGASRRFGRRVALDGDVAVIGQTVAGAALGTDQVFIHRKSGANWPLERALASPNPARLTAAGFALDFDLDGEDLLVADGAATPGGRALLYERQGGAWPQTAELEALPLGNGAPVGSTVALDGDIAVLAGFGSNAIEGRAALFQRTNAGGWRELASMQPNQRSGLPPDDFGSDVAIGDSSIVIGAPRFVPPSPGVASGSAFAFNRGLLMHGSTTLSVTGGGQQDFLLMAGLDNAQKLHWIVGSASGTTPGAVISPTITIPLNYDSYALSTLSITNAPPILGRIGLLDPDGISNRNLVVPFGLEPSLAGVTVHHAYLIFDPFTYELLGASNAVALTLVP